MNGWMLICFAIGFVFVVGTPVLMHIHKKTYIEPLQKSIEWQFKKAEKIGNGWLPPAYRDFASDEEREAAIRNLLSQDGMPVQRRKRGRKH